MDRLDNIEEIKSFIKEDTLAFLYISTAECNVCKDLLPKVRNMLTKYPKIVFRYVEINDALEVSGELSVFSVPVLLFFIEGKETLRESRYVNMSELEEKIKRYYFMLE